jgi:hypothetical protein
MSLKPNDIQNNATIQVISRFLKRLGKAFLAFWASSWPAGLTALIVYSALSWLDGYIFRETSVAYFNYLADAFLHGQLYLRLTPQSLQDLVLYKGHIFLYWAPFPALLLMPLVALGGVHIGDVNLVIILAALNVGLVALLLKRLDKTGILVLDSSRRGLLVLFFALGSALLPVAPKGGVWATSQLIGFLCVTLAFLAATSLRGWRAFLLTGLAFGCAAATRNQLLFAGIWPAYYLLSTHWREGRRKILQYIMIGLLPVFLAVAGLAWYNWARFGSPTDVGLKFHNMLPFFRSDFTQYGVFNLHYLPTNIYYQYINYPFPWRADSLMGGSLFLLSPVLFGAFWGIARGKPRLSVLFLVLSIVITSIPILLLMGTGWIQVGPRYTLDFHIPLIFLTALGIKRWPTWLIGLLVLVACVQYFLGTLIWFSLD